MTGRGERTTHLAAAIWALTCGVGSAGMAQTAGGPPLPPRRPPEAAQAPAPSPQPPPEPPPKPRAEPAAAPDRPAAQDLPAAPETAAASAQEPACRAALRALDAHVRPAEAPKATDPRCAMSDPLILESVVGLDGARIAFPDGPTLDCAAAEIFARFVAEALAPLAEGALEAPLSGVSTGPGFVCRPRDNVAGAKLSAHGRGLAVDVAALALRGGKTYEVGRLANERERALDRAARAAGCGYFNTALGPGADAFHATHWHFDLETRGASGKAKFCQ